MSQSQVTYVCRGLYLIYIYSFKKPLCVCLSVNHTIHFIVNTTSKHAVIHTQRLSAVQCAEVKMGFIFGANLRTMPLNCDRPSLTLACSGWMQLDLPLFPFFPVYFYTIIFNLDPMTESVSLMDIWLF